MENISNKPIKIEFNCRTGAVPFIMERYNQDDDYAKNLRQILYLAALQKMIQKKKTLKCEIKDQKEHRVKIIEDTLSFNDILRCWSAWRLKEEFDYLKKSNEDINHKKSLGKLIELSRKKDEIMKEFNNLVEYSVIKKEEEEQINTN